MLINSLIYQNGRALFWRENKINLNARHQYDKNVLLIYFDLKKFKLINNNYGYGEGDKVLKIFSQILLNNFRKTDAVARLGGDMFCALCPGMFREHLPNVIRRLQNKISVTQINHPIEFSVGTI